MAGRASVMPYGVCSSALGSSAWISLQQPYRDGGAGGQQGPDPAEVSTQLRA